jgi:hypothetical protein
MAKRISAFSSEVDTGSREGKCATKGWSNPMPQCIKSENLACDNENNNASSRALMNNVATGGFSSCAERRRDRAAKAASSDAPYPSPPQRLVHAWTRLGRCDLWDAPRSLSFKTT